MSSIYFAYALLMFRLDMFRSKILTKALKINDISLWEYSQLNSKIKWSVLSNLHLSIGDLKRNTFFIGVKCKKISFITFWEYNEKNNIYITFILTVFFYLIDDKHVCLFFFFLILLYFPQGNNIYWL